MSQDETMNEAQNEERQHPALEKVGFSEKWEYFKEVAKTTAITALKGAVIAAIVGLVLASPFGAIGGMFSWLTGGAHGTAALAFGAGYGAMIGAIAGAAIGLAKGFDGAEDAVEDKKQALISQYTREKQLHANAKVLEQHREKMMAWQPQQAHTPMVPMQQPQLGVGNMYAQQGFKMS